MSEMRKIRKSDMRAILALSCIAVVCAVVLAIVKMNKKVDAVEAEATDSTFVQGENLSYPSEENKIALHSFDPNEVDSLTLISFGLKPYQVKNFIHYRDAGAVFPTAESMGKTYGWTKEDVQRLSPYVKIGEKYKKKDGNTHNYASNNRNQSISNYDKNFGNDNRREYAGSSKERPDYERVEKFSSKHTFDINTVDSATLRKVPGIGEKICSAILKKRERLGGFVNVNQLLEISIVSPEILDWFAVSPSSAQIRKININKASFQAINSHPYISYDQTRDLLNYRRLYGSIPNEQSLLETGIFTTDDLMTLRFYIEY